MSSNNDDRDGKTKEKYTKKIITGLVVAVIGISTMAAFGVKPKGQDVQNQDKQDEKVENLMEMFETTDKTALPGIEWASDKATIVKKEKELGNKEEIQGYDDVQYIVVEDTAFASLFGGTNGTAYYWFEVNGEKSYLGAYSIMIDDGTDPYSGDRLANMETIYKNASTKLQEIYGEPYELKSTPDEETGDYKSISFVKDTLSIKLTLIEQSDESLGLKAYYTVYEVSNNVPMMPEDDNISSENKFEVPSVNYSETWGIYPDMTFEEVTNIVEKEDGISMKEIEVDNDGEEEVKRYCLEGDVKLKDVPGAFVIDFNSENKIIGMAYLMAYDKTDKGVEQANKDFEKIREHFITTYGMRAFRYDAYFDINYYDNKEANELDKYCSGGYSKYDQFITVNDRNNTHVSIVMRQFFNEALEDNENGAVDEINGVTLKDKILINTAMFTDESYSSYLDSLNETEGVSESASDDTSELDSLNETEDANEQLE